MGYQHYIFDLYGTLVDIRTNEEKRELWEEMARWYGAKGAKYRPKALRRAWLSTLHGLEREEKRRGRTEIQIEEVFRRLFESKNVEASPTLVRQTAARFRRLSRERLCLYDGAKELLATLRGNGQKVWLLTNAQHAFTSWELTALGIGGLFHGIYISSDYGLKKPDRRFFELLLKEQDIDPAQAIMIGNDGACDIKGAKAVGLATMYIPSEISPKEAPPAADFVLPEMDLYRAKEILTAR